MGATRGIKYVTPDHGWEDDKVADSAVSCQDLCAKTPRCERFTYFTRGMCRLHDATAKAEQGGQSAVVSGPPSCLVTTTHAPSETTIQHVPTPGEPAGGSTALSGETLEYMLQMNFVVKNVDYTMLGEGHRKHLQTKYAEVLAEQLEIHPNAIMETPHGPTRLTHLSAMAPSSTRLQACALNNPIRSSDLSKYKDVIGSSAMLAALETATSDIIHFGNTAVVGHVEVEVLPSVVLSRHMPPAEPTGWARWWPFLLLLLLICIAVAVISGAVDVSWPGQRRPGC